MREIKFRAWGTEENHMWAGIEIEYDNQGSRESNYDVCCFGDYLLNTRYKVMQYTGLKDRNGVEIYEGDIVKVTDYFMPGCDAQQSCVMPVVYDEWACFDIEHNSIDLAGAAINGYAEVIGNIYENPELVEVGK